MKCKFPLRSQTKVQQLEYKSDKRSKRGRNWYPQRLAFTWTRQTKLYRKPLVSRGSFICNLPPNILDTREPQRKTKTKPLCYNTLEMTKRQELGQDNVYVRETHTRDKMRLKSVNHGERVMQLGKPRYKIRKGPTQSSPTWWQTENNLHMLGGQPVPTTNRHWAAFSVDP